MRQIGLAVSLVLNVALLVSLFRHKRREQRRTRMIRAINEQVRASGV
jgi:hypothetical protein